MGFKMKGSPAKLGTIHGTSGHASALKMRSDKIKAAKKAGKKAKTLDDYIKEGFTPKDALQMMKDGATTGRTPDKAKKSTVAVDGQLNDAQKEYETDKKLLAKKKSPAKQVTDPKKKKTEKTYPKGYTEKDIKFLKEQNEDVVRYEDLYAKGQAIWKKQGKPIPKKKSPMKSHKKGHKDQQGPIPEKNPKLRKSEMEGTWVYPGKGTKSKFVTSERMNDLEERSSFIDEDVHSSGKKKTKQQKKDQAFLKREADIIRDRTRNQKKYKGPFKSKSPAKYDAKVSKKPEGTLGRIAKTFQNAPKQFSKRATEAARYGKNVGRDGSGAAISGPGVDAVQKGGEILGKDKAKKGVKKVARKIIKKPGKVLKTIGKALKVGSRILGPASLGVMAYDAYKSGQKHSGGKVNPNQKQVIKEGKKKSGGSIMAQGKKKAGSIYKK